jgi:hypothetical protein
MNNCIISELSIVWYLKCSIQYSNNANFGNSKLRNLKINPVFSKTWIWFEPNYKLNRSKNQIIKIHQCVEFDS